jgi:hypothetical protein
MKQMMKLSHRLVFDDKRELPESFGEISRGLSVSLLFSFVLKVGR